MCEHKHGHLFLPGHYLATLGSEDVLSSLLPSLLRKRARGTQTWSLKLEHQSSVEFLPALSLLPSYCWSSSSHARPKCWWYV